MESTPGEGSTFFFDLEACPEATSVAARPAGPTPAFEEAPDPALRLTEEAQAETASGAPSTSASGGASRPSPTVLAAHCEAQQADSAPSTSASGGASRPIPTVLAARCEAQQAASLLVVDDEPVIRQVVSNQLTAHGFRVTPAASGEEALRLLAERTIDLVILDVMMPRMSGFEVCRKLRERYSLEELPVIFLTARNQAEDLVVGLAAGANDYLPKPLSKSELLARVQTHLALLLVNRQLASMVAERTLRLTERERLLSERERLIGELEEKNAELARFNYTVAHDLKNPLVTIRNYLGLMRRDATSGRTKRLEHDLDRLDSAAAKLGLLLDELFELSRVGIQANPSEDIAFGELVREALAVLAGQVAERGIEVTVAPELPVVHGDRRRLLEAVRHLLDNAIRYLGDQPAPRIEIGARPAGDEPATRGPVFYVRDNGIGIEPKYHERVFSLFERLDLETSEGTGIGLTLVRRIVEVHGGKIWVESEGSGRGSKICFTLPSTSDTTAESNRRATGRRVARST